METKAETGKDSHSDIAKHKRTLPFFRGAARTSGMTEKDLNNFTALRAS